MSTALVSPNQWEQREFIETIKQTVAKGATDAQLKMFIEVCKGTGLNPFLKEIWFVPAVGVMAGRDGYLRVANEHPMFDGMETKVERDDKGVPLKATCSVWRKDRAHPITCEAWYSEYRKSSPIWQNYPSAMISKVAEVLALKRSFSINGVVTEEEIGEQKEAAKGAQIAVAKARIEELKQIPAGSTISPQDIADTEPEPLGPSEPVIWENIKSHSDYEQREAAKRAEAEQAKEPTKEMKSARKRGSIPFDALKHFGVIKKALREETGDDTEYYRILKGYGYDHADEIVDKEEARNIYKTMAGAHARMVQDAELQNTLTNAQEALGIPKFIAILGAHGCENVTQVLAMDGTPLENLLSELKQAIADQKGKE